MIFIAGIPRSGKTTYTKKYFKDSFCTDLVYISMAREAGVVEEEDAGNLDEWAFLSKTDLYALKKKHYEKILPRNVDVIEGYGLCFKDDRHLISTILGRDYTMFFLSVGYEDWVGRWDSIQDGRNKQFKSLNRAIEFPEDYFVIDQHIDISRAIRDYPELATYQDGRGSYGTGFIKEKYKRLNLEPRFKTIIDVGGNAGEISLLALKDGAKSALVVDINWLLLKKARKKGIRTALLDINYLENLKEKADIVICASVLHYFKNQDKIIADLAKLTKETLVLEMPVSQTDEWLIDQPKGTYKPPKEVVLEMLSSHFRNCWVDGESIPPDNSYRLVFKATV